MDAKNLQMRRLGPEHADAVMALQAQVVAALEDRKLYVETSREDLLEAMERDHVLGICAMEQPVAVAICICNRQCPGNLGQKFEQPPQECFTFDAVFVHPAYRGLGLQRRLIREAKLLAMADGASAMWCTISPENIHSHANAEQEGFYPYRTGILMYGGKLRDVMKLDL